MEKKVLSCEFNIDTACVEVKYADGSMISIDCTRVENEIARNMYEASELDWLIYSTTVLRNPSLQKQLLLQALLLCPFLLAMNKPRFFSNQGLTFISRFASMVTDY